MSSETYKKNKKIRYYVAYMSIYLQFVIFSTKSVLNLINNVYYYKLKCF